MRAFRSALRAAIGCVGQHTRSATAFKATNISFHGSSARGSAAFCLSRKTRKQGKKNQPEGSHGTAAQSSRGSPCTASCKDGADRSRAQRLPVPRASPGGCGHSTHRACGSPAARALLSTATVCAEPLLPRSHKGYETSRRRAAELTRSPNTRGASRCLSGTHTSVKAEQPTSPRWFTVSQFPSAAL